MELDEEQSDEIFKITLGGEGSDEQKEQLKEYIKKLAATKKAAAKKAKATKAGAAATTKGVRKGAQDK